MRSWYSMPFFGVGPPPPLCSRRPHRTFVPPLSPWCRAIVQVETRSLCAHSTRCSSLGVGPCFRRGALAVHIGRLYRSRHRAGRSYKSRRARCALMVLDALLWRRTAAAAVVSSRRPHRTFIQLSPSFRAIVQSETRSLRAHGTRCPSLASDRRRCVLSPST